MKVLIIFFLTSLIQVSSYSQDSQLFENTWYLKNLIIDNQNNFPPNNNEVRNVTLDISLDGLGAEVCSGIGSDTLEFDSIYDLFSASNFVQLPMDCNDYDNQMYQVLYFNTFFKPELPIRVFEYQIEVIINESKRLILTNEEGNQAIYGNEPLSTQDFSKINFAVFPNPAAESIIVCSNTEARNLNIQILNIQGKLLSTVNLVLENQVSLDVSNLSSGIYFLNIEDEKGRVEVKKFIKE